MVLFVVLYIYFPLYVLGAVLTQAYKQWERFNRESKDVLIYGLTCAGMWRAKASVWIGNTAPLCWDYELWARVEDCRALGASPASCGKEACVMKSRSFIGLWGLFGIIAVLKSYCLLPRVVGWSSGQKQVFTSLVKFSTSHANNSACRPIPLPQKCVWDGLLARLHCPAAPCFSFFPPFHSFPICDIFAIYYVITIYHPPILLKWKAFSPDPILSKTLECKAFPS